MADKVLVWLLVEHEGTVLLVRRKPDEPPFGDQWVLPGDEMPEYESAAETLARVGKEELGVEVSMDSFFDTIELADGDDTFAVNIFRVAVDGRPRYREDGPYEEAAWAEPAALPESGLRMPSQLLATLTEQKQEGAHDADDQDERL
jgi:ADP-ribose pyrophosphatase YjhB (NUDIX family)